MKKITISISDDNYKYLELLSKEENKTIDELVNFIITMDTFYFPKLWAKIQANRGGQKC